MIGTYMFRILTVPFLVVWVLGNWYVSLWHYVLSFFMVNPYTWFKWFISNGFSTRGTLVALEDTRNSFVTGINEMFGKYATLITQLPLISDYIYQKYIKSSEVEEVEKFKLLPLVKSEVQVPKDKTNNIIEALPPSAPELEQNVGQRRELNAEQEPNSPTQSRKPKQPSPPIKEKIDELTVPLKVSYSSPTTYLKTDISPLPKRKNVIEINSMTSSHKKDIKLKLIRRQNRRLSKAYLDLITSEINGILLKNVDVAPLLLRLAWHCCATYDMRTHTGGSNGSTMRFLPEISDEGNNGLDKARAILEPVKLKYSKISYADLWTFAGKVSVEFMGGPEIDWKGGRVDYKDDKLVPPNGRLPFGDKPANHIRDTFTRMGFTDKELVALLGGGHSVGECHPHVSGWDGKWTKNPYKFSNDFFKNLLNETWKLSPAQSGTNKVQYYNKDKSLMMLITDFQLLSDKQFYLYVKYYSEHEQEYLKDFSGAFSKLLELGIDRSTTQDIIS